jgi:hypothetical protein
VHVDCRQRLGVTIPQRGHSSDVAIQQALCQSAV